MFSAFDVLGRSESNAWAAISPMAGACRPGRARLSTNPRTSCGIARCASGFEPQPHPFLVCMAFAFVGRSMLRPYGSAAEGRSYTVTASSTETAL